MNVHAGHAAIHCPDCAPRQPMRNHWFWGKNILPRDLTDEQIFFLEKIRLHHQRLHGSGVVCGLDILQHSNAACRDRLLLLNPGSAIDCCGHDILVLNQDVIDLEGFPAFRKLKAEPDGKPHTLQFCISYRECPAEEVPVLYDECACGDTRCAPNRILESYAIELMVDPPPRPPRFPAASYRQRLEISVAGANAMALDRANRRLFLAKGSAILEHDAALGGLKDTRDLGGPVHGLAVAAAGARLDAVAGGAPTPDLVVHDIAGPVALSAAAQRRGPLAGFAAAPAIMVEADDGSVILADVAVGLVQVFAAGVPAPVAPVKPAAGDPAFAVPGPVAGAALSTSGTTLYVAQKGQAQVSAVDLSAAPLQAAAVAITTNPASNISLAGLAVHGTGGADRLVLLDDGAAPRLLWVDPATGKTEAAVKLDHKPAALAMADGGEVAHVLVRDGDAAYLQAVNLLALRNGQAQPASPPLKLPDKSSALDISETGELLYVLAPGGILVFDVEGLDCAEVLKNGPCPGCDSADCLVLATVRNWRPGFALLDMPPGGGDAVADAAAKIARIDNSEGRSHLASTRAIQTMLECLLAHPVSGIKGEKGDKGDKGDKGEKGDPGAQGIPGQDGNPFDDTLAHLCAANWKHAGVHTFGDLQIEGRNLALLVSFDKPVKAAFLNEMSIVVEARTSIEDPFGQIDIWRQLRPEVIQPLQLRQPCTFDIADTHADADGNCIGLRYIFNNVQDIMKRVRELGRMIIRIRIIGDLIPDKSLRGIDANHLPRIDGNGNPYWIGPPGGEPYFSGDGIAGGTFESWFELRAR